MACDLQKWRTQEAGLPEAFYIILDRDRMPMQEEGGTEWR